MIGVILYLNWQLALMSMVLFPIIVYPIVKFGSEDLKKKYLSGLASGERLATTAVTEATGELLPAHPNSAEVQLAEVGEALLRARREARPTHLIRAGGRLPPEVEDLEPLGARMIHSAQLGAPGQALHVCRILTRYIDYGIPYLAIPQYDEDRLSLPKGCHVARKSLDYQQTKAAIFSLQAELLNCGEAGNLFGQERDQHLEGILGNLEQTFDGKELYPSVEEKAAHLLYFVIKDHPFSDGNKRIGAFLFVLFLRENDLLEQSRLNDNGLVALALLIAESDPGQKDLLIRLIINLLKFDRDN